MHTCTYTCKENEWRLQQIQCMKVHVHAHIYPYATLECCYTVPLMQFFVEHQHTYLYVHGVYIHAHVSLLSPRYLQSSGSPMTVTLALELQHPYLLHTVHMYTPSSCWVTFCSRSRQFSSPRLVKALSWLMTRPLRLHSMVGSGKHFDILHRRRTVRLTMTVSSVRCVTI